MRSVCRSCKERTKESPLSSEELKAYCKECRYLERLESPGMQIVPVYSFEALQEAVEKALPLVTRDGLVLL